ncbi:hydrolase, alpha/beta fold family protein [Cordyceps fumosorosea ARSEF 2679]|uniref:Hydrolase, alpha/beta fold family protein n=1 Tax=Cordyceps fumosorosea (strain ARSEF 2679) TaxID=1081104 RepID=A0A167LP83_CORFA|nr:hydrolase, alpha/beta fold family protein [Cordyceps fumosorosea ARSEF 2679]OAA53327.1 hydrolase, alpha/beta fold family protein [Cordyceps fumosorosea ARSEF 2679]
MDRDPADGPPIAVPSRTHSNRLLHHHRTNSARSRITTASAAPGQTKTTPGASPEIISDLISSLSTSHFDALPLAATGPSLRLSPGADAVDPVHDVAATSPVVRTAKPPSGYSAVTSPKSPRLPTDAGFRSHFRAGSLSRASSSASLTSRNDDARSIGNLSIEPGTSVPPPNDQELRPRRSHDSWGKKTGRRQKDMLYMSSKERLREKDMDRKRPAAGAGGGAVVSGASSIHSNGGGGRADAFLAETAISEEPGLATPRYSSDSFSAFQAIPNRESSLRKPGQKKRSSARRSRQNSESDPIPEGPEYGRGGGAMSRTTAHKRVESEAARSFLFDVDEYAAVTQALDDQYERENGRPVPSPDYRQKSFLDDFEHEGAPAPAIANGRRAYEREHGGSGRLSPFPSADLRAKGSGSKLKRLSGVGPLPLSPSRTSEQSDRTTTAHPITYERPASADSIDDDVESYLCSPRLSQKITHPQTGRVISFSEVGDPEGSAVFCCVGMGLTRYITTFYDELALTLKLRLITPDRPGVGDSEPYSDGTTTPLSWPDDVYAICQALKITKFSILAHSAGAIYALATALRMPQHIRGKIHLLAPWIPPSQMNVFGSSQEPPTHALPTSQRILRALPTPILKAANSSFMSATSSSITSSLPKSPRRTKRKSNGKDGRSVTPSERDNAEMAAATNGGDAARPVPIPDATENMDRSMQPPQSSSLYAGAGRERQTTYDLRLTHAIWDLATTGANPAVDLLVCLERRHAIGFRYVDITRPVVIHHGSKDNRVPVDNVRWLGKGMRRCEVRVLEGEGHGLMASASVMGSVLMEMSKEWEDWMRVTGDDSMLRQRERGRRTVMPQR